MATITYMYWNVQNFGDDSPKYKGDYGPLAAFIARVARAWDADIFALVELKQNGVAQLNRVRLALNRAYRRSGGDWHFDWIKGSYAPATVPDLGPQPAPQPNSDFVNQSQLAWSASAHSEGYALFWNATGGKFNMVAAANRQSGGAPAGTQPGSGVDRDLNGTPVTMSPPALENVLALVGDGRTAEPYPAPPYVPGTPWVDLNFPQPGLATLVQRSSRRPAFFTATRAGFAIPCVVYHAPSQGSNLAGTYASALSRSLYHQPTAIACGDYNVDQNDETSGAGAAYGWYTNPYAARGADMQMVIKGDNANNLKTVVKLDQWIKGPPILSGDILAYLGPAIDNLFVRGFANIREPRNGTRGDLLTAVMGGSLAQARPSPVTPFLEILNAATAGASYDFDGNPEGPDGAPIYPSVVDYPELRRGIRAGTFGHARQAAEFIRLFISDHLPLFFRFDV